MHMLIMGPPGAGKGTQAKVIAAECSVPAISTGDIFRSNVAGRTDLGQQVQGYLDRGEYVPDDLTNALVAARLREPDAVDGFLLDGYPRTTSQVAFLDDTLAADGARLDTVLQLVVERSELVARLLARARSDGRTDDTEDVIRRRQEVYAEQTAPLLREFDERGLLVSVDGTGSVDEVTGRALAALRA